MQLSPKQTGLALGLIVVVIVVLAFVLWTRTAPPAPQVAAGQTSNTPFGSQASATGSPGGGVQAPAPRPPSRVSPSNGTPFTNEEFLRRASGRATP
ncbi:MAG TPA: hypothetical protein VFB21_22870 [Chthonomonadaceae bacterium]|nr:hypothetical protein [Chthonomonadaceae bacterium]